MNTYLFKLNILYKKMLNSNLFINIVVIVAILTISIYFIYQEVSEINRFNKNLVEYYDMDKPYLNASAPLCEDFQGLGKDYCLLDLSLLITRLCKDYSKGIICENIGMKGSYICDKKVHNLLGFSCFNWMPETIGELGGCSLIENEDLKKQCILESFEVENGVSKFCEQKEKTDYFSKEKAKAFCYYSLFLRVKDPIFCNKSSMLKDYPGCE